MPRQPDEPPRRARTMRNKTPLVGWHPPAELADWLYRESEQRGGRGARSAILTEALRDYRDKIEGR